MLTGTFPEEDHLYETLRFSGTDDDSYVRDCGATGHREKASILGVSFGEKKRKNSVTTQSGAAPSTGKHGGKFRSC